MYAVVCIPYSIRLTTKHLHPANEGRRNGLAY